jgi:hypothetical protein
MEMQDKSAPAVTGPAERRGGLLLKGCGQLSLAPAGKYAPRPNSNRQLETIRNSYNPPNIKQITFSNRPKKSPLHAPQIPFHLGASNGYSGSTDSSSPEAAQCLSGTIFAGGRHSH